MSRVIGTVDGLQATRRMACGDGGLTRMGVGCLIADRARCPRSGPAVRGGFASGGERTVSRAVNPVSR
jgi:hypothetical protein